MKKVAVVCAAGKEGRLLVKEALARGYAVTGFVRNAEDEVNAPAEKIVKDLFALTKEDLVGFDVVLDAFGAWTPETLPLHKSSLEHLCDILSGTKYACSSWAAQAACTSIPNIPCRSRIWRVFRICSSLWRTIWAKRLPNFVNAMTCSGRIFPLREISWLTVRGRGNTCSAAKNILSTIRARAVSAMPIMLLP